jgi:hypothetical protein
MYLINCTKQNQVFFYREPRRKDLWHVQVASGQQELFGLPDWGRDEWAFIIKQMEHAGIKPRESISGPLKNFSGLLYSEHEFVDADVIEVGHAAVVEAQDQRSVENATRAAAGFAKFARTPTQGKPGARIAGVVVEEQPDPYDRRPSTPIVMDIEVNPEGRSDVKLPGLPSAA